MKALAICLLMISSFTVRSQILNSDFEQWHTDAAGGEKLDDWKHFTDNADKSNSGQMLGTWRVTNAQSGNYALKLSRWYASDVDNVRQKAAIGQKPGGLTGYYIYEQPDLTYNINGGTGHITDTALVLVYLTHWNAMLNDQDTVGMGLGRLGAASSYTPFSIPISYTGTVMPDSVSVLLFPTSYPDTSNAIVCQGLGSCSFLTIDNLQLGSVNAITSIATGDPIAIFPNPAYDRVHLRYDGSAPATVRLVDALGRMVGEHTLSHGINTVDLKGLPGGTYLIDADGRHYRLLKL